MVIVITDDQRQVDWVNAPLSGAVAWGSPRRLSFTNKPRANRQLRQLLETLDIHEPLCLLIHLERVERYGSASKTDWFWTHQELAVLLTEGLNCGYNGPILLENSRTANGYDFVDRLADWLQQLKKLNGLWVYNCNGLVSVTRSFPNPHNLEAHIECYGRQVRYLGNFPLQRTPRLLLH